MSLSLSVRSHFVSLEHSKHLKQDILRELQGCLKFQGCFEDVSRMFQGSFKGVKKKFKGVSRNYKGCFKEVSRVF